MGEIFEKNTVPLKRLHLVRKRNRKVHFDLALNDHTGETWRIVRRCSLYIWFELLNPTSKFSRVTFNNDFYDLARLD